MIMLYTLLGVIIFFSIVIIIGIIKFDEKIKRKIFIILSAIYNCFIGYIDTPAILLMYGYFSNQPKGSGYSVPDSEIGFNILLGLITMVVYLILLIPINIFMKKKGKIDLKLYMIVNIIATILGIAVFWTFLGKNTKIF